MPLKIQRLKKKEKKMSVFAFKHRNYPNILDLFQRSWREFFEKKNKAATVIQIAWRSSLKRPSEGQENDKDASDSRPGRSR